jgi:hypothetical protein
MANQESVINLNGKWVTEIRELQGEIRDATPRWTRYAVVTVYAGVLIGLLTLIQV